MTVQTKTLATANISAFPVGKPNARNAHLLPEIYKRSQDMIQVASQEMANAVSVERNNLVEVWKELKSGSKCTCSKSRNSQELSKEKNAILDLRSFLMTGNLQVLSNEEFCPLCSGSGFIGGFGLKGTFLQSLHAGNIVSSKENPVKKGSPWSIPCIASGDISWFLTIPKYYDEVYSLTTKWGNGVPEYSLYIGANKEPLTRESIRNYAGKRILITMHLNVDSSKMYTFDPRSDESDATDAGIKEDINIPTFFCLNLYFIVAETLIPVDLPNYTYNYTGELSVQNERNSTVSANFAADSGVDATTVFVTKDGIIWRINSVVVNKPLEVPVSLDCEARLVRTFENYYMLPSRATAKEYILPGLHYYDL